ncbi:MAG: family 20 glycosylhydrolase, partial [Armatimonadetes bacterium]|nr:family 20 glycosylhydrolase [Armatimonadota bacterium]
MTAVLLLSVMMSVAPARIQVLPEPKQAEDLHASVRLTSPMTVFLGAGQAHEDDAYFAARLLILALDEVGIEATLKVGAPAETAGEATAVKSQTDQQAALARWVFMGRPDEDKKLAALASARRLKLTDAMAAEGYALSVQSPGVVLVAQTPAGLLYGVQTLRQLLAAASSSRQGVSIPAVRIHDWPTMKLRGVMYDTSRGQVPTLETAKRLVDFCSYYKLNFYSPYIEHTFAWEGHEDIWRGSGAWTAEDFLALARYARPLNVTVIPQFEAMGHQNHILTKERYKSLAETKGWSFAPAVEGTYTLLDDLMGQMSRAFPFHPFFGIGCDEVYDMGAGRSKELMKKLGGKGQLFASPIQRLTKILARYGRRPMMWGDMMLHHPETMGLVPKDVIILDWHYGAAAHYPSVARFRKAGYDVVVCPGLSSWVRIFPDYINAFTNIQNLIADGQRNGALGAMTCNWGDWGAENLVDYNWLGWAWSAACSWSSAADQDRDDFEYAFARTFYGNASRRLVKAQWDLAQANRAFPWAGSPLSYFHGDPFSGKPSATPGSKRLATFAALLDDAEENFDRAMPRVRLHRETLPYLLHPLHRYRYVLDRARGMKEARKAYSAAYEAYQAHADRSQRDAKLRLCRDRLQALRDELAACREEFRQLWLKANRLSGLAYDLRKFDAQLKAYDKRLAAVNEALKTGNLPAPDKLGLAWATHASGLPVVRGKVTPPGSPRAAGRPYWVPVRIEARRVPCPAMPIVLRLNLAELTGGKVAPTAPVLVVGGKTYPAQVVPLWTPDGPRPGAGVAFLLPQPLAAG